MSEAFGQPDVAALARASIERQNEDLADPLHGESIRRVREVRDKVFTADDEALSDAYDQCVATLPIDSRLYHYFIGSTPPASVERFDGEGEESTLARVEAFAKEHGL